MNSLVKACLLCVALLCLSNSFAQQQQQASHDESDTLSMEMIDLVVIRRRALSSTIMSNEAKIRSTPSILGEVDILKYVATQPGVITTSALDPNIYVRGGAGDENRYYVNQFPVANPQHLTGILAMYDPYILNNSTLYKGGYPARYSGGLSSHLNMIPSQQRDSVMSGELSLGLLTSSLRFQLPIGEDETEGVLRVAARYSYLKLITDFINKIDSDSFVAPYSFGDVTSTYFQNLGRGWQADIFVNYLRDRINLSESYTLMLDWYSYTIFGGLHRDWGRNRVSFHVGGNAGEALGESGLFTTVENKINGSSLLRADVDYARYVNNAFTLSTGVWSEYSTVNTIGQSDNSRYSLSSLWLSGLYVATCGVTFNVGANLEFYSGESQCLNPSPRVKINYKRSNWDFWIDYALSYQYTTKATLLSLPSPADQVYLLEEGDPPAMCNQISVGTSTSIGESIELYGVLFYKQYDDAKEFVGVSLSSSFINTSSVEQVCGDGMSRGVELECRYQPTSKVEMRVNYTFTDSWRQFADINDGERYHPPYDVMHSAMISASYELNRALRINCSWQYSSGLYTTFPSAVAVSNDLYNQTAALTPIFDSRYNYQLPASHRLDVSVEYQRDRWRFDLGVYNLYNQQNISFVNYSIEQTDTYNFQVQPLGYTVVPVLPYISVTYQW